MVDEKDGKEKRKNAAPQKKAAPKKKVVKKEIQSEQEPRPAPLRPTPPPRRKQHNAGGGRMFGFFLLILVIVGAIIGFQSMVDAGKQDVLKDKLGILEQKTTELISKQSELIKEKGELREEVEKAGKELKKTQLQILEDDIRERRAVASENDVSEYCEIIGEEDESIEQLVNPKYTGLQILGEIFTASECADAEVLSSIEGLVDGTIYSRSFSIGLFSDTSVDPTFASLLSSLGFDCTDEDGESCMVWERKSDTSIDELLGLYEYVDFIRYDRVTS
jgi:hypothetical protein